MKNLYFLLLIFILSSDLLFSQNSFNKPYDMILARDEILDDIRYLSLESGKPFLSFTPPLSPDEVKIFLDSIDDSSLSKSAREAYFRILERLSPKTPISFLSPYFSVFLNIYSVTEVSARTDTGISWYPQYPKIEPIFSLPVKLFFSDYFQLYFEPNISVKPGGYGSGNLEINFPSDLSANYMPIRSFAAFGNSWLSFQIGRDRLSWGSPYSGNLIFSDNSIFYDFARISFIAPFIKYSVIVNQMPLSLDSNLMSASHYDWKNDELQKTMHRYYYLHRIDFTLFEKINFGIMEGAIIGNSQLELRYLNPILLFHSLYTWNDYGQWGPTKEENSSSMVGSIISLDINWNITKSFSFFIHAVMNQLALSGEIEKNKDQPPNGFGYITGFHYSRSFFTWSGIFYLEMAYTDPYLHLSSSPFGSFIQMNRKYFFMGYPRDTFSVKFGSVFSNADWLSLSFDFSWIASGEHNKNGVKWDWIQSYEAFEERAPTSTVENTYSLSFGVQWKPVSFLSLNTAVTGIYSVNNNHVADNNKFGAQALFSVGFNF